MRPPKGACLLAFCVAWGTGQWAHLLGSMVAALGGNCAKFGNERQNEELNSRFNQNVGTSND